MKLLFVNSAYPRELYRSFYEDANGLLSIPMDVFQWSLIDGLEGCGVDYSLVSIPSLPAWPRYSHVYTPSGEMKVNQRVRGGFLRFCNLPAIKQISQKKVLSKYVGDWCEANKDEKDLQVLLFTQQAEKLSAIVKLKESFKNLRITVIITDLIENAQYYATNRPVLKRIQVWIEKKLEHKLFPHVDKYILLSRQMVDFIPEAMGRNIVVEGIVNSKQLSLETIDKKNNNNEKILLYTGILEEYAGIDMVLDAFVQTTNPNYKFVICGVGSSVDKILSISERDKRIVYKGKVPHHDTITLQKNATILINPRRPDGRITKYSFPSKTMEYMISGTPMIGYKLEGVPDEYFNYMYIPVNYTVEALAKCVNESLSKPQEELDAFAEKAKKFVLSKKNNIAQVKRIIEFIENR